MTQSLEETNEAMSAAGLPLLADGASDADMAEALADAAMMEDDGGAM